jgi:FAD synthetase
MKKVMCFGTFDVLHLGHINFFKQAKACGDQLVVIISRDINVKKTLVHKEEERKGLVESIKFVDKALLGNKNDFLSPIIKEKPELICLGYDQPIKITELKELLKKRGFELKIKRLKPYLKHKHKSSIIKKKINASFLQPNSS